MIDHEIATEVIDAVDCLVHRFRRAAASLGGITGPDAREELNRRTRSTGWRPQGRTSAGGSCRMLPTRDGHWMALNLARPDDVESLPALFETELTAVDGVVPWTDIARCVVESEADMVRRRAIDLGVPVAIAGETEADSDLVEIVDHGQVDADTNVGTLMVVDLSSLWAGPLVGRLLAKLGCRVVKVESITRPDGARGGPPDFFAALNEGKEFRSFDFRSRTDIDELRRLIAAADVVIEASRPRALEQLGIDRDEIMGSSAVRAWLSITAHGRCGVDAMRVGFGDDAAVAGGLVRHTDDGVEFIGDAIADPITGLVGAAVVAESLVSGRRQTLDVSLARSAAYVAAGARLTSEC